MQGDPGTLLDVSLINFEGDVEDQVTNVLEHVRLSRSEVVGLRNLLRDLEEALRQEWPECEVLPFGSIVTGLGIKSSDVDVYVRLPDWIRTRLPPVIQARNILRREPWTFANLFAIPAAKVPIVKFFHRPTGCNCDVNFKSENGVRNSKLIFHLLKTDSRILNLAILVKYWSKVLGLTGTNLLANYALTMLVIFYLQAIEILVPVVDLQLAVVPVMVDNWNTAFDKDVRQPNKSNNTVYHLLGGFFKYYSSFRFDINVVSPYIGAPVPKSVFDREDSLYREFNLYKENLNANLCLPLRTGTLMCIQDPFEHSRNCSIAVSTKLFHCLMLSIQHAARMYDQMQPGDFLKAAFTKQARKPIIINNINRPVFTNNHAVKPNIDNRYGPVSQPVFKKPNIDNRYGPVSQPVFKKPNIDNKYGPVSQPVFKNKKSKKRGNNIAKKYTEMQKNLKRN